MYEYSAIIRNVHDGDSITVDLDQGLGTWKHGLALRLYGCNAQELGQPGGGEARDNLAALLPVGTRVTVRSYKADRDLSQDKYGGRYDAAVTLPDGRDLVALLIAQQWVAAWDGKGSRPVPPWPRTISTAGQGKY
jgi:endonuclease YncB( thermonuclease family)